MKTSRRHLAEEFPALDPRWAEDLLLVLRVREVSGARIGEILGEANEHCLAAGHSAATAFGPAARYAESLDFAGQERARSRVGRSDIALGALGLAGAVLASWGGSAAVAGEPVSFRVGHALILGLLAALFAVLVTRMQWVVTHMFASAAVAGSSFAAMVGLLIWGGPELASTPAVPAGVLGFALLIGGALAQTRAVAVAGEDLVVGPGEHVSARDRFGGRLGALIGVWLLPVVLAAMVLVQWFLAARS